MDIRFPIGGIQDPAWRDAAQLQRYQDALWATQRELRELLQGRTEEALNGTYREGSWTVRQLAHHVADAHEHGFMRFRWGLTEDNPVILPFDEAAWARLPDYALAPEVALALFEAVNVRWLSLLAATAPEALNRTIRHPAEGQQTLWHLLAKHEWHARHHAAHLRAALGNEA